MWKWKKKETEEKPVEEKTCTVELRLKSHGGYRFGGMTSGDAILLVQKIKEAARQPMPYVPELPLAFAQDEFVSVSTDGHFWKSLNTSVADKIIGAIKDAMPKPTETMIDAPVPTTPTQSEGDDPVRVGE